MTTGGLLAAHCARLAEQGRATIEVPPKPGRTALRQLNTSLQGRTAKLRNPFDARLGGWSGYTSRGYRPPGRTGPRAVLAAVKDAARRPRRSRAANLDCACARRGDELRPGRVNAARPNEETS